MTTHCEESWISIAAQVSLEKDATKLAHLVQQLCCALDSREPLRTERKIAEIVTVCPGARPALTRPLISRVLAVCGNFRLDSRTWARQQGPISRKRCVVSG